MERAQRTYTLIPSYPQPHTVLWVSQSRSTNWTWKYIFIITRMLQAHMIVFVIVVIPQIKHNKVYHTISQWSVSL